MQWLLIYTNIFEQNQKCDSKNTKERELKLERKKNIYAEHVQSAVILLYAALPFTYSFFLP